MAPVVRYTSYMKIPFYRFRSSPFMFCGTLKRLRDLTPVAQNDIKSLFSGYRQACAAANLMLVSLGNLTIAAERCQSSAIGQKRPNSLQVMCRRSNRLVYMLRLYEGCASRPIVQPQGANVIKFYFCKPKISYLFYPDFDSDPHSAMHTSMEITLRDLHVCYWDYDSNENPLLLHQNEVAGEGELSAV